MRVRLGRYIWDLRVPLTLMFLYLVAQVVIMSGATACAGDNERLCAMARWISN